MDIDRAKAVAEVAARIIDSARVEVEYTKATGTSASSSFLLPEQPAPKGVTVHRLK